MIGQVQTKKANAVARWAAAVHTVDSARLVAALDRGVALALERGPGARGRPAAGAAPVERRRGRRAGRAVAGDLDALADAVAATRHLSLRGLMCVPPRGVEPGPVFARGRRLLDAVADRVDGGPVYSAGMSGDLRPPSRRGDAGACRNGHHGSETRSLNNHDSWEGKQWRTE